MGYEILMERKAIIRAFREHLGPGHQEMSDKKLMEYAGWEIFYQGWKAGIDHSLPIKKQPLGGK